MIAIGSSIGTAFFLGSGQALATGGPAFLLLAYTLMSCLVYGIVTGVIEMSTFLPIPGASISYYGTRYVSSSLGFALGWLYFYSFGIIVAYELTAASILIGYWPNDVNIAVWITLMMVVVIGLNLCAVGIFAETEFWFASIKVITIIGLLILSFVLMLGGGPSHERLGFRYWNDPGAVRSYIVGGNGGRLTAFLSVLVFSGNAFCFGAELLVFTAGEMQNPRESLPLASRRYFVRLVVFYVLGTLAIGVICPYDAQGLTTGSGNANASPFVIAVKNAGISILPSIINIAILTSAWSAGNSCLYMSSRALYSLAIAGNAPEIFMRCNRYGLPVYAVLASSCFAPLAYFICGSQAGVVFNWLVSLTNTAGILSWIMCCIIFFRFRQACDVQAVSVPYRSKIQPHASWICLFSFIFLLLANGFTLFFPGRFTASGFLTAYFGIVVFVFIYLGHRFTCGRNEPWIYDSTEVDLTTGVAEVEADGEMWRTLDSKKAAKKRRRNPVWRLVSSLWQ